MKNSNTYMPKNKLFHYIIFNKIKVNKINSYKHISFLLILFIIISSSFTLNGQKTKFTAFAPKEVKAGQRFNIVYELNNNKGKSFTKPNTPNLQVRNVSTSFSSSIKIVNGKTSTVNIQKYILSSVINKEGKITIPPATIKVNGKTYSSNKLTINVTQGVAVSNTNTNDNSQINDNKLKNKDIFLNFTTNKTEAYIGEPIYSFTKMFSRYHLSLSEFNPSDMADFWIQDLPMPNSVQAERTNINGVTYLTAILEKKLIFPQKTGTITIEPYNATFQLYDGWGFPAGTKKVVSNKKIIKVKPLPANKPKSFAGAVGQFDISISSDIEELEVDNAITIKLKISGSGNFGLFDNPKLNLPKRFEELMPDTKSNTRVTTTGIEGSKTYIYKYIARVPGDFTVKPIEFSYFDPKLKKYVTTRSNELNIKVLGDTSSAAYANYNTNTTRVEATELENDIRFIKTSSLELNKKENFIFGKLSFWLAYLIPLILFFGAIILLQKRIRQNANIDFVKSKKADKVSIKRLKTANKCMLDNNLDRFYEEITKALWGYVSDKLSIPVSELTRQTAAETLSNNNVDEKLINDFIKVIDLSETARYAQNGNGITPQTVYDEAGSIIANFEKNIYFFKKKS